MAKSLKRMLQETQRKIEETKKNLEDLARISEQCLEANKDEAVRNLSNRTYSNLKIIPSYLLRLSKSQDYKEVSEQLVKDFKGLAGDYLFLKEQYSL